MRSITTDQGVPVAISMPGRYKSCRRSPSELFTKEQEQDLQRCAAQSEEHVKAEEDSGEAAQEKASSPVSRTIEANPPKLTPLRWRSTSMKELNNGSHEVAAYAQEPAVEESTKTAPISPAQLSEPVRPSQVGKRPSQAQLRAQVMNSLLSQQVVRGNDAQAAAGEPVNSPAEKEDAPEKEGSVNSSKPVEHKTTSARTELFPQKEEEEKPVRPEGPEGPEGQEGQEEQVKAPETRDVPSENGAKVAAPKPDMPVVPINEDLPEEVVFQPVDLDQKYREKELVRHVTAAKIQNREEALLNNPGSPALNGRKRPVGEEPAAMTIEFLRARLQAERSASKTVKLRMESLSKKVVELESRLLAEVDLRKSAEGALHDALAKLKLAVPQAIPIPTPGAQKVADGEVKDAVKTVQRGDVASKAESVESNKTVCRDEVPSATSSPLKEMKETSGGNEDSATDGSAATVEGKVVNKGGLWRDRSVSPYPSPGTVQGGDANGGEKESVPKGSPDSSSDSNTDRAASPSKQQEKRAVIEERLRSMWAKIGEDMAALTEVRGGDEDSRTKDAMGWKGQLPSVLQEKQQSSGDSGGAVNGQQVDSSEGDSEQAEGVHSTNGKKKQNPVANKAADMAEKRNSFKRNSSLAKNVAKLVEQYELQETAQREWEEQQSLEQNEGEPPALVTPDGDLVTEGTLGARAKGGIARTQSQGGERNHQNGNGGEPISRSKSMGFLPSQQKMGPGGKISRRGSLNGKIEVLDDGPLEESAERDLEELLFDPETEVAEELPNGIYLHHSRAEVGASYATKRGSPKDTMYRRGTDRVGSSNDMHSPRRTAHHSRERFPRTDSHGDVIMDHQQQQHPQQQQQGWPVREVQDRASRDMYRNGPWREGGSGRAPPPSHPSHASHYPHPSSDEPPGIPYGYSHRDHPEQDVPYGAAPSYRQRDDGRRGMPAAWQEGGRGMNHHPPYGYPPGAYSVEEPQQPPYGQAGLYGDAAGYRGRDYMSHGTPNPRAEYYSSGAGGMSGPGPRPSYAPPPDRPPAPASQGYSGGWENSGAGAVHEDRTAAPVGGGGVKAEDSGGAPAGGGEAGEVLKALRIAKQQIKSSTVEQAAFMTAQYTVSQEHRYGAGGQVSKTSYTVEAPVGWHLDGGKATAKRNGMNGMNGMNGTNGLNVTELISGAGPLTVTGGESSYVEKLNVGRGIQFFFSG